MKTKNFCVTLFLALQSGFSSNSYLYTTTTTSFRRYRCPISSCSMLSSPRKSARGLTSAPASSSSDANFSTFADSLESDLQDDMASSSSSSSTIEKTAAKATTTNGVDDEKSWQAKLDELLDPKTNVADRQILLSELLTSNDKIRDSVLDAITNRKLDPLLTPTQKKLQEGTRAVVRQLANDILPQITSTAAAEASSRVAGGGVPSSPLGGLPSDIESIGTRLFSVFSNQIQKNLEDLQEDLTDPINKIPRRLEKQRDEVLQEARNVFLEKPEGLEEPPYTVAKSCDLYEIRHYEAYTVASTAVSKNTDEEGTTASTMEGMAAGSAFNVLAAYIFGANDESKVMSMTTPVTTTSAGDMRFYLVPTGDGRIPQPAALNNSNAKIESDPAVSSSSLDDKQVEIVQIPPALLAIRKFTGFVTDGEVARQKDTLLQALEMDGVELDVAHGSVVPHVVFQYNPPYTLPMVRRNEIGVPVRNAQTEDEGDYGAIKSASLKEEWTLEDELE